MPFEYLHGTSGLWVFLNHPLREPKLTGHLKETYDRLFIEANKEIHAREDERITMPDWTCTGCGRHYNISVFECPYCKNQATVTTNGNVSKEQDGNELLILANQWFDLSEEHADKVKETCQCIGCRLARKAIEISQL